MPWPSSRSWPSWRKISVVRPSETWVPSVSATRLTGWNVFERNLAARRRDCFADDAVFYLPVRIDVGDPLIPDNEPRGIKRIQAVRKPGGHFDEAFIAYLRELQEEYVKRHCPRHAPDAPSP